MTMPQALFMLVHGKELVGRERQAAAYSMLVATMTAMGTDKSQNLFSSLMRQFEGTDPENWLETASEAKMKVLFGSRYTGRESGAKTEG